MLRFTSLIGLLLLAGCEDSATAWPFALHSTAFQGPYSISGTIALPAELKTSAQAALTLTSAATLSPYTTLAYIDEASVQDLGEISGAVSYSVTGLAAGRYLVGCLIDHDRDGTASAGDIGGYYDGTAESPLFHGSDARVIELVNQSLIEVDFGIGPVTCLARYGEPCTTDADCGGTICTYENGNRQRGLHSGTCDAESGQCVEAPGECPLIEDQPGTKSEAGCFGAGPE